MSSLIGSILGGGSGGGSSSFHPYSPTGLSPADSMWQGMMGDYANNLTGPNAPGRQVMQSAPGGFDWAMRGMQQYGDPAMNVAANNVAPYYWGMASQADAFHNLMSDLGNQDASMMAPLQAGGQQVFNTAMDPQKALYDRTLNQVQQQSRGASDARGLGTSPYAAGLENQATSNFNIDWQNQQLQRQLSGLQGLGTASTTAGKLGDAASQQYVGSQAMSALAPQLLTQSANAPLQEMGNLWNMGTGIDQSYMNTVQGAFAPELQMMNQIIPYLNYGQGAQANAFNAGQTNLGNIVGAGGLLSNNYGMGPGQGYGPLGSLFSNPFGSSGFDLSSLLGAGSGVGSDIGMSALTGGIFGP